MAAAITLVVALALLGSPCLADVPEHDYDQLLTKAQVLQAASTAVC